MKVRNDPKFASLVRKKIIDVYTAESNVSNAKRAKESLWHVSDLIFPRQTYYNIVQGRKVTDTAIGFWFTGKAYHAELQRVLGAKYAEVEAKWGSVVAHIDHLDRVLIEIKTSRKWTIPELPAPHYIRQAGYYCAMTGKKQAKIVVVYPTSGRTRKGTKSSTVEVGAWELSFTAQDLKVIQADMNDTIRAIEGAVKKKDPGSLPPVPDWLLKDFDRPEPGDYDEKDDVREPFNFSTLAVKYV